VREPDWCGATFFAETVPGLWVGTAGDGAATSRARGAKAS
jgi:hypothetical protein